jgi:hypothetical protein
MGRIHAFFSYAHKDSHHLADLEAALAPLREEAIIDSWTDVAIKPGQPWDEQIKQSLERSHLILFLVTPALLQSQYINSQEIPLSLARRAEDRCVVVPVLTVRPDDEQLWFDNALASIQPVPKVGHWISDYSDTTQAYDLVRYKIREACQHIGGGNPLLRADVGDWRHVERTAQFPNGMAAEWEYTEELVEKTSDKAVIAVEATTFGQLEKKRIEYDLNQPLENQMEAVVSQLGMDLTPAASMSTRMTANGPEVSEEIVVIGLKRYETRVESITSHSELKGLKMESQVTLWRSIDVVFDGAVKLEQNFRWENGISTTNKTTLLDFGFGDSATRKPVPRVLNPLPAKMAASLGMAPQDTNQSAVFSQGANNTDEPLAEDPFRRMKNAFSEFVSGFKEGAKQQRNQPAILPGHWTIQSSTYSGAAGYDVMLFENSSLQGTSWNNGMQSQVQGRWYFDHSAATLVFEISTNGYGYSTSPFSIAFTIVGSDPGAYHLQDAYGGLYRAWMI